MKKKLMLLLCLLSAITTHAQNDSTQTPTPLRADLIIENAMIRTMDAHRPLAEALAVYDHRIVAVGTTREINELKGARTLVINAEKRLVLPGFNDAHVHFLSGGFQLANVDLRDAASKEEFVARLRAYAAKLPRGRWITGGDWDHERWPGAGLPTKELIDPATPATPILISRLDGHMALANSLALKLAGVTRATPDPAGGLIVRDAGGEPTGVLKDAAMNLVGKMIPSPGFAEKLNAARAASAHAASLGVTSVQDMSAGDDVGVYQTLLERGELLTRIYAVSPLPDWERLARTGVRAPFGNEMLRIGGLKGFADGSLGSTTALLFAPYNDAPQTRGLAGEEMPDMPARVAGADAANLQVMIHAIGDSANDQILTIYENVMKRDGERDRRFRIEHAQHLRPEDIARFGRDHIVASMQPYHLSDDGRWAEKRIGPERARTAYAFRSLLDSGAVLAFGSDWTVAPMSPLMGIHAAVTRRTLDGLHPDGWTPSQKISVAEAVRAYTYGSAYAEFAENNKGTLAPGMLADMVILARDIFTIAPTEINNVRVQMTIMNGRVVYKSDGELKK